MRIKISNRQEIWPVERPLIEKALKALLQGENIRTKEVELHFVSKEEIAAVHATYFQDPTPTDCISFPIDGKSPIDNQILGIVFVCPEVAKEWIEQEGGTLSEEVLLYVIHGALHLVGYDDIAPQDAAVMRQKEALYLKETFAPISSL
ncbi:MAG: putative rRNA maturation factor [Chlamydiales bacterium]|jgi:probable rRNA maturation factor|nr:putative rRNA maturation factor [Chlamydiales bacterium]